MTRSAALVLHGRTLVGRALTCGLDQCGIRAIPVDVADPGRATMSRVLADAVSGSAGSAILGVVVPVLPGLDDSQRPLAEYDDSRWAALAEAPLRAVADALVAARAVLSPGSSVVLVGPAAAMTGAAGLAGYVAAAEGARALSRSLAAAWDPDEVAVHWVSVATEALLDSGGDSSQVGRRALLEGSVANVVHGLLQPTMRASSGTTVSVRLS